MQIFVQTLEARTITLFVDPTEHLDKVTAQIKERLNFSEKEYRLLYAGKQLQNGRPLTDYGIAKDCTLHMVAQMIGGY